MCMFHCFFLSLSRPLFPALSPGTDYFWQCWSPQGLGREWATQGFKMNYKIPLQASTQTSLIWKPRHLLVHKHPIPYHSLSVFLTGKPSLTIRCPINWYFDAQSKFLSHIRKGREQSRQGGSDLSRGSTGNECATQLAERAWKGPAFPKAQILSQKVAHLCGCSESSGTEIPSRVGHNIPRASSLVRRQAVCRSERLLWEPENVSGLAACRRATQRSQERDSAARGRRTSDISIPRGLVQLVDLRPQSRARDSKSAC